MQENQNELCIRPARPEDVGLVLQLIRELAEYERLADQVVATEEGLRAALFERKVAHAMIAEAEGEPVGFVLYFFNFSTFEGHEGLYLEDLFVRPQYRGRGYGKALFGALAAVAQERGCPRFEWSCLDWNTHSIGFYRSLGAVPMDEWTVYRLTKKEIAALADSCAQGSAD